MLTSRDLAHVTLEPPRELSLKKRGDFELKCRWYFVSCPLRLKGEREALTFALFPSKLYVQKMRYVAAYLLAVLGGNSSPSKGDVSKILESIGLDIEDEKLDLVF